jgi:hypothetical protein
VVVAAKGRPAHLTSPVVSVKGGQAYTLSAYVRSDADLAAVDIVASANSDANVCINAVQLEEGPSATPFEARYPIEARLTAHKYFSGLLHLYGEPLELDLVCHARRSMPSQGRLELRMKRSTAR